MSGRWLAAAMVVVLLGSLGLRAPVDGSPIPCGCTTGSSCPRVAPNRQGAGCALHHARAARNHHTGVASHHHSGTAPTAALSPTPPAGRPQRTACVSMSGDCGHSTASALPMTERSGPPPPAAGMPLPAWAGWLAPSVPGRTLAARVVLEPPPPRPRFATC